MTSKSFSVQTFIVCVFALSCCIGLGFYFGQKTGFVKGLDFLFNQCYTIGGVVIDEENHRAMLCAPVGKIPEEELQDVPLDKKSEMWYDRNKNTI